MDENVNEPEVLLVKSKDNPKLEAVVGTDEKGGLRTAAPKKENEPQFLKIDKHSNVLENFFSNLSRQFKDPTHLQFFRAPLNLVDKAAVVLEEMFKQPETPDSRELFESHRVDPADFEAKKSYKIDESRIDWDQFERLGVSRETLEKTGSLDAMLSWQKSPVLIPIVAKLDDTTIRTEARLSLRETPDGKITVGIHALRREPELDRPYFGVKFTDEDKQNLRQTGNLGRVVSPEYKQGEQTAVFLSVDKLTNELVAVRADRKGIEFRFTDSPNIKVSQDNQQNQEYFIPKKLGGVELPAQQQEKLKEGGTIYVEGMKDKEGKSFNAYVKFNFEQGKPKYFKWNPDKAKAREVTPDNAAKVQVAVNSELLDMTLSVNDTNGCPCPKCTTGQMQFYSKVVKCNNESCGLPIFRSKSDKTLTDTQITSLLTKGKTSIIKGFKSKAGKLFDASLAFDDEFRVVFIFAEKSGSYKKK